MPEDDEYHTVAEQIEGFTGIAFRRNLLTKTLCSILDARRSRNPGDDDSTTPSLLQRFFDSPPVMDRR